MVCYLYLSMHLASGYVSQTVSIYLS